jgi:hypothetical protein
MAAELTGGGEDGAASPGHPDSHAAAITNAATQPAVTADITADERAGCRIQGDDRLGFAPASA